MHAIVLLLVVAGAPGSSVGEVSAAAAQEAARQMLPDVQTGSLIFSQGDCLAVKVFTASRFTHVGCVVVFDKAALVYDSTSGAGVRKLTLAEFLRSQGDADLEVYSPVSPFSAEQSAKFERHLEGQLGRPYAISHHLTGRRSTGLHCAEYATDALAVCGLMTARQPARVSPTSLREAIAVTEQYESVTGLRLEPEPVQAPEGASWCVRAWFETRQRARQGYRQLWSWFCCK